MRAVKTRGGDSLQHRWLISELHRTLPASTVEGMVGTKSVDILIALNNERDKALLTYLAAKTSISLNTRDLVAIEVETSAPDKTGPNNTVKNTAAGIALTVVAVLPKDEKTARTALKNTASPFVVVNVLELLLQLKG